MKYHPNKFHYFLVVLFLIPGLIVCINKIIIRSIIERTDRIVEIAIDFNEFYYLARTDGWSIEKLYNKIKEAGATSIAFTEDTLESLEFEGKIKIISLENVKKYASLIPEDFIKNLPIIFSSGIFIYSEDPKIINRIERNIIFKSLHDKYVRVHENCLFISKFDNDFLTKTGFGFDEEKINLALKYNLLPIMRIINYPNLSPENVRAIIRDLPPPSSASTIIFAEHEILGNRGALHEAITALYERGYRIGYVEFHDQTGMQHLILFYKMRKPLVRVHSISRKELDEIYNPQRAIARFVRAVRERSVKLIYVRCFLQHPKLYIPHMIQYNIDYLKEITSKLKSWNYSPVSYNNFHPLDFAYEPKIKINNLSYVEKLSIYLSSLLFLVLFYSYISKKEISLIYISVIFIVTSFLTLILPDVYIKTLYSLLLAILTPIFCIQWIMSSSPNSVLFNFTKLIPLSALNSLKIVFPSTIVGIIITGMFAEAEYLMYFEKFRGIKIALAFPIIFNFIYVTKKLNIKITRIINKKISLVELFLTIIIFISIALYVLRSGNISYLKPNALEDSIRTFLEETLIARPRNKEFLIGYPSIFIINYLLYKNHVNIIPIVLLFATMASTSIINTFCHFHIPIHLSFIRTINGFWLGLLFGIFYICAAIILNIIIFIINKQNKAFLIGYFGFGNIGDEILWKEFTISCSQTLNSYRWVVLYKTGSEIPPGVPSNTKLIPRSNFTEILEEIASSKFVIIPGGGVIQSKTSLFSLLYYFSLLFISKIFLCKILLPAQGIGPLYTQNKSILYQYISRMICRFILEFADYFSVRDSYSYNEIKHIFAPPLKCKIASDLAFIINKNNFYTNNTSNYNSQTVIENCLKKDKIRIGVVLRNTISINYFVSTLNNLIKEYENLEITPIIFQQNYDEVAWQGSNLTNQFISLKPDLNEIYKVFKSFDIVISMRLHACILATIFEIPWIGINIDTKIEGFAQMINWNYIYSLDQINSTELLANVINKIIANSNQIRLHLLNNYTNLHKAAKEELEMCINLIQLELD